jgi:hypothetical protein
MELLYQIRKLGFLVFDHHTPALESLIRPAEDHQPVASQEHVSNSYRKLRLGCRVMTHASMGCIKDSSTLDTDFWQKPKKDESGALNQKTCRKAGLGGRKPPFLALFRGQSGG